MHKIIKIPLMSIGVESVSLRPFPINEKIVLVSDVHGTLFKPTWKKFYREIFVKLTGVSSSQIYEKMLITNRDDNPKAEYLSKLTGISAKKIMKMFIEERKKYNSVDALEPEKGAMDVFKAAYHSNIPIVIISGGQNNLIKTQLKDGGFMEYLDDDNIFGANMLNGKKAKEKEIFCHLKQKYPDHTFIMLDDWTLRFKSIHDAGGFVVAKPQGAGEEFQINRLSVIEAGADWVIHSKYGLYKLAELLSSIR